MLDGRRLTFGFHGIWQGTALLYDHATDSLWFHHTGEAIAGPLAGRRLQRLSSGRHTRWGAWHRDHPTTTVIARESHLLDRPGDQGYFDAAAARSGDAFLPSSFAPTIRRGDPRLEPHALVYGVRVGEHAHAFPYEVLAAQPLLQREIGGMAVVVRFDPASRSASAYRRRLGDHVLRFERDAQGIVRDVGTRSRWDMDGRCIEGRRRGQRLEALDGLQSEWYGWFAHHPSTTLESSAPSAPR